MSGSVVGVGGVPIQLSGGYEILLGTTTVAGDGGGGGSSTVAFKTQNAVAQRTAPTAIPATVMSHGAAASANTMITGYMAFQKGHLPTTSHLVGSQGGTAFAVQQDCESHWKDGSVRLARLVFALPSALTADTLTSLTFTPTTGAPTRTAWITPTAMVAAKDINVKTYGGDLGSLTYGTSVRDIVTNLAQDIWGANPIGGWDVPISGPLQVCIRAWRYRKDTASGNSHKWIKDHIYHYANSDGTHDIEARSTMANWDTAVAASGATLGGTTSPLSSASAIEVYDGTTRIYALGGPNDVRVATVAASTFNVSTNAFTPPTNINFANALSFAPASGGTLPSGLTAGTTYWTDGSKLYAARADATHAQNAIVLGTAGTGNIVVTPLVGVLTGTSAAVAGTDGKPLRIGTARPNITWAPDEVYTSLNAKFTPPYDQSYTRYASTAYTAVVISSYPNQMPWGPWLNTTGDDPGDNRIGYLNHQTCLWWLLPHDTGFASVARQQAYAWLDQAMWWDDPKSGRIIVADNGPDDAGGTYPQMGLSRINVGMNGQQDGWVGGYSSGYFDGYSAATLEASHMPAPWVIPAFLTGSLMLADCGIYQAITCGLKGNQSLRHPTLNGKRYYNVAYGDNQPRAAGWLLRAWGFAEAFTPYARPEAAYIAHDMDTMALFSSDYVNSNPPNMQIGLLGLTYGGDLAFGGTFQQYQNTIFGIGLAMEAWRNDRAGWSVYLQGFSNFLLGIANDAAPAGGTGWIVANGYSMSLYDNTSTFYTTLRQVIANNSNYYNAVPPFPATGMHTNLDGTTSYWQLTGWQLYKTTDYATITLAFAGLAKLAGVVSINGDDASVVYSSLVTRLTSSPCTGLNWSTPGNDSHVIGAHAFPAWAFVPA